MTKDRDRQGTMEVLRQAKMPPTSRIIGVLHSNINRIFAQYPQQGLYATMDALGEEVRRSTRESMALFHHSAMKERPGLVRIMQPVQQRPEYHLSPVLGEPPIGFRAFKWGSPPNTSIKKGDSGSVNFARYAPPPGKALPPFLEAEVAGERYYFANRKLFSGQVDFRGHENFEKMKTALFKAYGEPSSVKERADNYEGERGIEHKWIWNWHGTEIHVMMKYFTRTLSGWIDISNGAIWSRK